MPRTSSRWFVLLAVGAAIAACGGGATSGGLAGGLIPRAHRLSGSTPIQHVIVVIQENRSFDNFFATFPGANGATSGQAAPMPSPIAASCQGRGQPVITQPTTVPLTKVSLVGAGFKDNFGEDNDLDHIYGGYVSELDGGRLDGYDLVLFGASGLGPQAECTYAYQYVSPSDIKPYWDIAKQYVLADNMFDTQGSSSFTGHQDLIAGGTAVNYKKSKYGDNSIIDNPFVLWPWGCDSPPGDGHVAYNHRRPVSPGGRPIPVLHVRNDSRSARRR